MKYIAYIRICMLFIFLPFIHSTLSAQTVEKEVEEKADSTYHKTQQRLAEAGFGHQADSLPEALQTRSCVSSFTNQTVSSYVSVAGCSTLSAQSITVTSAGILSLIAPSDVTINGPFDVLSGGTLNVQCETAPIQVKTYIYTYDAAGNRIALHSELSGQP